MSRFALFVFLVIPFLGFAQTQKIIGNVVTFNKFPLANVTVKAKKAKTETLTNGQGYFELVVKKNDVLRIEEPGFADHNRRITHSDEPLRINLIFLEAEEESVDLVVDGGYISRTDLDYGLINLRYENNVFAQFTDAYDAIKYALPSATIINQGGGKGVQFRGTRSFTASSAALILVDGVIVDDVSFLSPINIISIRKLDNSGAALYGARGSNGVVIIETR